MSINLKEHYMLAGRYKFYVFVARTISHLFAALTHEILFLPLKRTIHIFSPPCNILYIFTEHSSTMSLDLYILVYCWRWVEGTLKLGAKFKIIMVFVDLLTEQC